MSVQQKGVSLVLVQELPSKTRYCRKDNRKCRRNGRRGRKRKHLPKDFNEMTRYWKHEAEALDRIFWRTRFGRNYGPVVRQTTGDDPKSLKNTDPRCIVLKYHRRTRMDRQTDTRKSV